MLFTGVGAHFSATHRSVDGQYHGHTWRVKAWFEYVGTDARLLQDELKAVLHEFDHQTLPNVLEYAESMAAKIGLSLEGCVKVEISRNAEGLYAEWRP